ncbi:MAG: class II glutamine amidotransferase [Idiomarina sp.]|nr:class II glutamine amidotransferase [Idiomarina sp.]
MCELLAMSCRYPAKLTFSLAALANRAKLPSKNQDGWGLAYYQGRDIAHYRQTTSAYQNPLVDWLMQHGPASPSQNARFHSLGETDSELMFCDLLERIAALPKKTDKAAALDERMQVIATIARQYRACGPCNFIYTDEDTLFVHADQRYQNSTGMISPPALYLFECSTDDIPNLICDAELPQHNDCQQVVLVATTPLSNHPWQALGRGELLALKNGSVVSRISV